MHEMDKRFRIDNRGARLGCYLLGVLLLLILAPAARAQLTNNDCPSCHQSGAPGGAPPNMPHGTGCTDTRCSTTCHPKDLNQLWHPTGPNTPMLALPLPGTDRTAICNTCHNNHWPGVYHKYQINVSASSPTASGFVDLNQACGQCHGGDTYPQGNAFAPYFTKAQLAAYAAGIHHDRPQARFGYTLGNPNTMVVNVDASGSICTNVCDSLVPPDSNCTSGCDSYDWDWGDGTTPHGSGVTASHTYATTSGTPFTLALTVRDKGVGTGTFSQPVTPRTPDSQGKLYV